MLLIGFAVMMTAAVLRGTEYDENYTMFLAAGTPRPQWPAGVFTPAMVRHFFAGHSTAVSIARDLRGTDVHPPLYFWAVSAWRGLFGTGLLVTRMASIAFSLAAVLCIGAIAVMAAVPPVAAMLLTIGCYGFSYTGEVARGFALAQLLNLAAMALVLAAAQRGRGQPDRAGQPAALAFAGGFCFGLASFTNYLAAFTAAAGLLWLLLRQPRAIRLWLAGGIGFALLLPADLWFFVAQRDSRIGQFPPFQVLPAIIRLAQYEAANVFGGLPLYFPGLGGRVVGGLLALALLGLAALIAWRWRRIATPGVRLLLAMALVASPVGLLSLGLVFDNTPIELRYLAFSMPFVGLLTAGAIASLDHNRRLQSLLLAAILLIQAASLAGMATRPETMQPQREAARAAAAVADADSVVLLPAGNDGVGIVAAFINEAPDGLHILVTGWTDTQAELIDRTRSFHRAVLVQLGLDSDSRKTIPLVQSAFATAPCWRLHAQQRLLLIYDRVCDQRRQAESGQ